MGGVCGHLIDTTYLLHELARGTGRNWFLCCTNVLEEIIRSTGKIMVNVIDIITGKT